MTAAPPPGWYPDPEAAGRRWRWWDGARWAPPGYGPTPYDPAAYARELTMRAETTRNTGRWLQYAMVAAFVGYLGYLVAFAALIMSLEDADGADSFRAVAWSVLLAPLQLVYYAFLILLIAWLYHAGKFADLQRWPAARNRTLGAFSLLIPIVGLWWPYEAVRDLYPPGRAPLLVLRWWLSYLIVPFFAAFAVLIPALAGSLTLTIVFAIVAAASLCIPAVLGWRLVSDVDAMQRAHLAS